MRARVHNVRGKGKSAFLVLRQRTATVQVRCSAAAVGKYTAELHSLEQSRPGCQGLHHGPALPLILCLTQFTPHVIASRL